VIKSIIYSMFMALPVSERMKLATWRFKKMREMFYRETRLDVAKKGLRNSETFSISCMSSTPSTIRPEIF